jgi:Tfp pilus assembly protein PilN
MIKVNLLQNRGSTARPSQLPGTSTDIAGNAGTYSKSEGPSSTPAVTRIVLLILGPAALMVVEQQNLSVLQSQANQLAAQVATIQATLKTKEDAIGKSGALKAKASELSNKIGILKKLAHTRLREIKALDYIQSKMPEKVWLTDYASKAGAVILHGFAYSDDDLNMFVRGLGNNKSFVSVLLQQAKEEKTKDRSVKRFEVTFNVESE